MITVQSIFIKIFLECAHGKSGKSEVKYVVRKICHQHPENLFQVIIFLLKVAKM